MLSIIILANLIISALSFLGISLLLVRKNALKKTLIYMVSLSAGTMIGGAFLHLLPEAAELVETETLFAWTLVSFIIFFLIEWVLKWRHCHDDNCEVHTFGYLNLIGDFVHNSLDGFIIAAAFVTDMNLGIATTIAVALHEIPQEIGDFGVLLYSGFKQNSALLLNLCVALSAVLGGILGFWAKDYVDNLSGIMLPFAAGGFLYIATSDLIPEMRGRVGEMHAWKTMVTFLLGIGLMWGMTFVELAH